MSIADWLSNPVGMNDAATASQTAGGLMGAVSHVTYGLQYNQAQQFQADQLRQQAGQAQASSQRQAYDADLQSKYVASAALASAAASGGGASDPTVVNLIARNASVGAYRQAVALYEGQDRARQLNLQADAKSFEGRNTEVNSLEVGAAQTFGAATSLLRGTAKGASLMSRFGGSGPSDTDLG